jgi:rubrerythrin
VALLGFAQSVELAARDLYDDALAADVFDADTRAVVATIRESHDAYAAALSGMLGRSAPQEANSIGNDLASSFGGDASSILTSASNLESTAVATHLEILNELQGTDGASLIAAILVVEARHGVVLAYLNGATSLDELLVSPEADPLTPAGA